MGKTEQDKPAASVHGFMLWHSVYPVFEFFYHARHFHAALVSRQLTKNLERRDSARTTPHLSRFDTTAGPTNVI